MNKLNIAESNNKKDDAIAVNRAQIEHRATWLGLIYEEMIIAGIDAEPILRRAIRRCGMIHGASFKAKCNNPEDCNDFRSVFLNEIGINTFEMKNIRTDKDNVYIDFYYCPLVEAWKKLGFDDERCATLCDIAMEGDRGIADAMGLKLDLEKTIAQKCETCKLHFHK